MEYYKLSDIFEFETGVNMSRCNLYDGAIYYDSEAFNIDFIAPTNVNCDSNFNIENHVKEGNLIFNLSSQKCAIASNLNINKILTSNFVKMIPKKKIDFKYVAYLLNEDEYIKKQKEIGLQGSGIQRITISFLKDINIPYLDLEKQKIIGDMYSKTLIIKNELNNYSDLLAKTTNALIKKYIEGVSNERI